MLYLYATAADLSYISLSVASQHFVSLSLLTSHLKPSLRLTSAGLYHHPSNSTVAPRHLCPPCPSASAHK